jgi:ribonuclease T1
LPPGPHHGMVHAFFVSSVRTSSVIPMRFAPRTIRLVVFAGLMLVTGVVTGVGLAASDAIDSIVDPVASSAGELPTPQALDGAETGPANEQSADRRVLKEPPPKAKAVLEAIQKRHGEVLPGYVGGRWFQNRERRLPPGQYREYDVNPRVPGRNRGAERLVIEQATGKAYYTDDHYRTFTPMN